MQNYYYYFFFERDIVAKIVVLESERIKVTSHSNVAAAVTCKNNKTTTFPFVSESLSSLNPCHFHFHFQFSISNFPSQRDYNSQIPLRITTSDIIIQIQVLALEIDNQCKILGFKNQWSILLSHLFRFQCLAHSHSSPSPSSLPPRLPIQTRYEFRIYL